MLRVERAERVGELSQRTVGAKAQLAVADVISRRRGGRELGQPPALFFGQAPDLPRGTVRRALVGLLLRADRAPRHRRALLLRSDLGESLYPRIIALDRCMQHCTRAAAFARRKQFRVQHLLARDLPARTRRDEGEQLLAAIGEAGGRPALLEQHVQLAACAQDLDPAGDDALVALEHLLAILQPASAIEHRLALPYPLDARKAGRIERGVASKVALVLQPHPALH